MAPHAAACEGGLASSSSVSRDRGERRPRGERAAAMRAPPPPPRDCGPGCPAHARSVQASRAARTSPAAWPLWLLLSVRARLGRERAGAQEKPRAAVKSRPLCDNYRGDAPFQAGPASPPPPVRAFVRTSEHRHMFCFLSSQRPTHSELVGVDMPLSRSQGCLRGPACRDAWNAALGPRVSLRKLAAPAKAPRRRGPSWALKRGGGQGATRAQESWCGRRGGAVARGCGLVPAAVAPCSPWPLTGGRRPSRGRTYLFPPRFNLGNKENYAGTLE